MLLLPWLLWTAERLNLNTAHAYAVGAVTAKYIGAGAAKVSQCANLLLSFYRQKSVRHTLKFLINDLQPRLL